MQLECIRAFGNFKPGDYVDIPGSTEIYDTTHFRAVPKMTSSPLAGTVVSNDG